MKNLEAATRKTAEYLYNIDGEVSPEMYEAIGRLRQLINEEFKPEKSVSSQLIYNIMHPAIEAYIAEQNAEAFIKWGWGERCESTDKEDFPDTDYEDPNNARCANCEMWEHYDEWLDHLSKKGAE